MIGLGNQLCGFAVVALGAATTVGSFWTVCSGGKEANSDASITVDSAWRMVGGSGCAETSPAYGSVVTSRANEGEDKLLTLGC